MEEVDKGYYLFDNYNLGNELSKKDLKEDIFFQHSNKMQKAREKNMRTKKN